MDRYQTTDDGFAKRRKRAKTKPKVLIIWTHGYRPFIMGGSCNYILGTTIRNPDGPHDLGGGFFGFLIRKPKGKTCVAEAETGAIIGETLDLVRADIRDGDRMVIATQMAKARVNRRKVELVNNAKFWGEMKS